jgi:arylsulfatase A-like enzyme
MVSFDWSAGAILAALKECGLEENTIVILSSDNGPVYIDGGYQDGSDANQDKGTPKYHAAAGIYRGGKYQIFEGGTRVPFIVRWPGRIEPGVSAALFSQVDLLASFAALLGEDVPAGQAGDSRNCLAALLGKDTKGPEVILEQAKGVAIRRGKWKYLGDEELLYDLSLDPSETKDVSAAFPQVAAELKQMLQKRRTKPLSAP